MVGKNLSVLLAILLVSAALTAWLVYRDPTCTNEFYRMFNSASCGWAFERAH